MVVFQSYVAVYQRVPLFFVFEKYVFVAYINVFLGYVHCHVKTTCYGESGLDCPESVSD